MLGLDSRPAFRRSEARLTATASHPIVAVRFEKGTFCEAKADTPFRRAKGDYQRRSRCQIPFAFDPAQSSNISPQQKAPAMALTVRKLPFALLSFVAAPFVAQAADAPATPDRAIVAGYERVVSRVEQSLMDEDEEPEDKFKADEAELGRVLLDELNCTSCHKATGPNAGLIKAKQAPILDKIGERAQLAALEKFLGGPHARKPGTTMPDVFNAQTEDERKANITALLHFLSKTGSVQEAMTDSASAARGEKLFHQIGCVACHSPVKAGATPVPNSIPLGNLGGKYTLPSLIAFLKNPLDARPAGRMPSLNLDDKTARDIASFFFKDVKIAANLNFAYYEGDWDKVPDFSKLKSKSTGMASGFDAEVAPKKNNYGLRFTGFIHLAKEGKYKFHLGSDDGSRLQIDGEEVVLNDGVHPYGEKSAERTLSAGPHEVIVDFTQGGGEAELKVDYEGKGVPRQPLASIATPTREKAAAPTGPNAFVYDEALASKGRDVFAKFGCASCHQLKEDGKAVKPTLTAKPLFDLANFASGCLGDQPSNGMPHYHVNATQRKHLEAAVKALKTGNAERTPEQQLAHALTQFNCYACHQRGKVGGVEGARNAFFETTIKEMGDEGRLPPPINGVGDKLNDGYLKNLLNNGAKDRGYMLAVMPKFAGHNIGHLADVLKKLDEKTEAPQIELTESAAQMKSAGRKLVGDKGLGCVKCHPFGQNQAVGIQAMDLQKMHSRLRQDWFLRYVDNPQVYRPGTRMPAPWPSGQVTIKDVLDAHADKQKHAIWQWLSDGNRAQIPAGISKEAIVLEPKDEPIVYRNFIEGVSPRAIAIGYPEKVHQCFDAENGCLALIWQGDFIDAGKHWIGRGPGNQSPLGDNVISLTRGLPIAFLETADAAWPTGKPAELGYQFKGYRFNSKRQPVLLYNIADTQVTDEMIPVTQGKQHGFARTLTIKSAASGSKLTYRVAAGNKIEQQGDVYTIDTHLKLTVKTASGTPRLRTVSGKQELVIDLDLKAGEARIEQSYWW